MKTYAYDADNRLSEVMFTKEGVQTLTQKNTYNGDGQRISKTDNRVTTKYSYQGGSVVYTDGSSDNKSLNIMGEVGNIIAAERDTGSCFYNKDMRGSTTTILDGTGNSKVSYEYTDFGETTAKGDFYNEICYTGGIYDKTTGLYYLNARYYDPDDGRFVTQDTYRGDMNDPGSLHLYAYCANNPVNYVDPSGHFAIAIPWILGEIGLGTVIGALAKGIASIVATSIVGITYAKARRAISIKSKDQSRISALVGTITSSAKKSWKHKRNKKRPVHHVIARTAKKAKLARGIWIDDHKLDINSGKNLVKLKQNLHKHLHTDKYFYGVNALVNASQYVVDGIKREFPKVLSSKKTKSLKKETCKLSVAVIKKILQAANLASKG